MSRSLNKVTLIGNLGSDPEVRATPNGSRVAQFSLATSRTWNDAQGVRQEKTEWHRCVVWNTRTSSLADIVERYCHKGEKVYVEGRIEYRQWVDKDGQTRYSTEVNVRELLLLGGPHTGAGGRASDEGDDADGGGDGDETDVDAPEAPVAREQEVVAEAPARSAGRRTTAVAATGRERTAPGTTSHETAGAGAGAASAAADSAESDDPGCPKCGGRMWDNRTTKRNPKAPDYKCRDRGCDGVIWPSRDGGSGARAAKAGSARATAGAGARVGIGGRGRDEEFDDFPGALSADDDDVPF